MTEDLNNSIISSSSSENNDVDNELEKDFYGCYCLKFRVKHGTSTTENQILDDFGVYGELVKVWGAGVLEEGEQDADTAASAQQPDFVVCVWFKFRKNAEAALASSLRDKYHDLAPAISDVLLPDNYGHYSISFINNVSVPSEQIHTEFSEFGRIVSLSGQLDTRGGRVFISYLDKESAIQAFVNKTERWYTWMRFEFPKCQPDYTGCYCLKFYTNKSGDKLTEAKVRRDFGKFGSVVEVRGAGLFDLEPGKNDVYVRYREKASAQAALYSLAGSYEGLRITPASHILQDSFGWYTTTFINKDNLSEAEVFDKFQEFGKLAQVKGTWGTPKGRIFVAFLEKEGATLALNTLVGSSRFQLKVAKWSQPKKERNKSQFCKAWVDDTPTRKRKFLLEQEGSGKKFRVNKVISSLDRRMDDWYEGKDCPGGNGSVVRKPNQVERNPIQLDHKRQGDPKLSRYVSVEGDGRTFHHGKKLEQLPGSAQKNQVDRVNARECTSSYRQEERFYTYREDCDPY